MNKLLASVLVTIVAASLTACGGGGEPPATEVAAADTTLPANGTTTAAVTNIPFAFPAGVTEFGTTSTTTVAFTDTSTTPAFSIVSGGQTATGTTTFGSCHFLITSSTFASTSKLAQGNTITVNPCNLVVSTKGVAANGNAVDRSIALLLGVAVSAGQPVQLSVNAGGQLTINGKSVGSVTLQVVT
jgi:predicted small lipoprotein YifL